MSGLIGARVEAGEGHKGIGIFEWNALERVEHAAANDGAPSADLAQARVVLLALGTRLDERLDPRVEACEDLVHSLPQHLDLGSKSLSVLKRLSEGSPDAADLGAPLD